MTSLTIPEEPRLAQRLREAAARGTLGHAIVLSGSGDLEAAARFTAAAMECTAGDPPCGICAACRKVLRDVHPDVTTVVDPDHKNIAVEILRRVVADAYLLPNEGRRRIYLFPDCNLLDPKAQNVLLKVLEDGPPHAAFLFCARNSAVLLPTIRSRTVEWKLSAGSEETAGDSRAAQLCDLLSAGRIADLTAFCTDLENSKISRDDLRAMLSEVRDLLTAGLAASCGAAGSAQARRLAGRMDRRSLSAAAAVVEDFIRQCSYNIGVGHLAGALAAALTADCASKTGTGKNKN